MDTGEPSSGIFTHYTYHQRALRHGVLGVFGFYHEIVTSAPVKQVLTLKMSRSHVTSLLLRLITVIG